MDSRTVRVSLDRDGGSYKPGEEITGEVVLAPAKDLACESLVLECIWVAVAEDNEDDDGTVVSEVLEEGFEVAAGEVLTFPFTIEAPNQPLSYAGKKFTVGWAIVATVKRPPRFIVGKEPQGTAGFKLLPRQGQPYEHLLPDGEIPDEPGAPLDMAGLDVATLEKVGVDFADLDVAKLEAARLNAGKSQGVDWLTTLLFGSFVGGGAYGTFLALTEMFASVEPDEKVPHMIGYAILALFAAAFMVGGAVMMFRMWRQHTTSATLGPVDLDVDQGPVSPGGSLHCRIRLAPPAPVTLRRVVARIEVEEGYTHEWVGRDLTSYYDKLADVVRKDEVPFDGASGMNVAGEAVLEKDIPVPADLPCSMYARNNRVHVRLALDIEDASGRVKWKYLDTLLVTP